MPSMPSPTKKKKNDASSSSNCSLPLVVVAGATGHIGSLVVKELIKNGKFRVRAIVRPKKSASAAASTATSALASSSSTSSAVAARLSRLGAEIWHGDVTEPATIAGCCDGASAAVSALGVRSFDRTDGSVWSVDRDGTLAFFEQARSAAAAAASATSSSSSVPSSSFAAAAATAASSLPPPPVLRVFVMVATFEGKDSRQAEAISEAKEEAVDAVVAAAKEEAAKAASAAAVSGGGGEGSPKSTLKVRILRPTAFFRDMSSWLLEPLLTGNKKDVVLTGDGGTKINPVDGRDVAKLVHEEIESAASSSSSSSNVELVREIPVGGPQVFTLRSMAALAAEVAASKLRAAASSRAAAETAAAASAAAPFSSSAAAAGAEASSSATSAAAAALHRTSSKPQELPPQIVIRSRPLWPLKVLAPLASLFAPCWGAAAALGDGARFVLYSATHDAVTENPYGSSTLRRYLEERADAVLAAAAKERVKGARRRRARVATTVSEGEEGGGEGGTAAAPVAAEAKAEGPAVPAPPVAAAAAAAL